MISVGHVEINCACVNYKIHHMWAIWIGVALGDAVGGGLLSPELLLMLSIGEDVCVGTVLGDVV